MHPTKVLFGCIIQKRQKSGLAWGGVTGGG